jgi:hypothetical protein
MNKMEWLDAFGYEINPDPDQPGKWLWTSEGEGSDISFDSEDDAICDALEHIGKEILQGTGVIWWNDPDNGICSGWYKVAGVQGDVLRLENEAGSFVEAFFDECDSVKTISVSPKETATVRLTLDVTYSLNGETPEKMASLLRNMCERAIGEGMLTGYTEAEVDEYSMDVKIRPESLDEDEVAAFMLQRIEDGNLSLEDIPVRLARYGLMEPDDFVAEMRERMEVA